MWHASAMPLWRLLAGGLLTACSAFLALPNVAYADTANTITAFIQPVHNCSISFIGNLVCAGPSDSALPITPGEANAAANPTLGVGMGYRICWNTAAGQTVPTGATCAAGVTPLTTSRPDFHATYPITYSGTPRNGCGGIATPNGNDVMFYVNDASPCTLTITAPEAPGFPSTRSTFAFAVGPSSSPLLLGPLAATTTGTGRVGNTRMLQDVICRYQVETLGNVKFGCEGVVLDWTVLSGRRSCRIVADTNTKSEHLGSVSVRFVRPGRCTVQGSYPAVPGSSDVYRSPIYSFTVIKGRNSE